MQLQVILLIRTTFKAMPQLAHSLFVKVVLGPGSVHLAGSSSVSIKVGDVGVGVRFRVRSESILQFRVKTEGVPLGRHSFS